jgi:sugar O-acyltransferase (sialic acid O-acetyltransferase NeuD family)
MPNFTPIYLPQSGPNDVTATIAEWSKPPGQWVQKGEVIGSAETTKNVFDLEAPAAGAFWPLTPAGSEAAVGAIIAALASEQIDQAAAFAWLSQQAAAPTGNTGIKSGLSSGSVSTTKAASSFPSTLRQATLKAELLAQRHDIDLTHVPASGHKITEADVEAYIAARRTAAPANAPASAPPPNLSLSLYTDLVDDRFPTNRPQRILIVGGGNGAVQILDALAPMPDKRAVAILDDNAALHGKQVAGVPIVGAIDVERAADLAAAGQFDAAVISISTSISARARVFEQWKSRGIAFANIIHPSCVVGINVSWGEGNVVMALCHFGACATIGDNNFLSAFCSIEHHCRLGSHCSFGPAVVTSSRVQIGDRVRFGTGIHIEPGIQIGADSVIASGLAITQHVPPQSLLKAHVGYSMRTRSST